MVELTRHINDNPNFISNIETIIRDRINKWKPRDLYLTRIDNWFDDKWIKFSGTVMHEISIWKLEKVTVPPFHPNRVESSDFYSQDNGDYKKQEIDKPLHIFQQSTNNLKRKIANFTDNGLFIWYSGNSETNNKGTLMCYLVKDTDCFTFYISLTGDKNWNVHKTNGIPSKEIQNILN